MLLVHKKKPVGAYLLAKPSGVVTGLADAQADMAEAAAVAPAEEVSGEPLPAAEESGVLYTDLPLDAEGYPVE